MKAVRDFLVRPVSERGLIGFVLYRVRAAIVVMIAIFFIATVGYVTLEHFSFVDGAFMTVITLSTVGYGEVHPLNEVGQIFTIGVIIAGFATLAYVGAVLTTVFTSGEITEHTKKSRVKRMRHAMDRHVIIVGFGRVGQAAARGVAEMGGSCVIIDRSPDRAGDISQAGYVPMIGDATVESDLLEAGIERATALVAAAEEDSVNLIVTLTARALCPELRIVSRVNEETWRERIVRAGASVAQSPYRSYGLSLAASAIHPSVLDMHSIPELGLVTEEVVVRESSALIGQPLGDFGLREEGVFIIGLRRDRQFHRWNDVEGVISANDVLVVLGSAKAVEAFASEN